MEKIYEFNEKGYKRMGKCLCCGQCCSTSNWVKKATVEQADNFFDQSGMPKSDFIRSKAYRQYHIKDIECMFYNPKTKACVIHKERPHFCRTYPTPDIPIFDGCGYKFEEVKGCVKCGISCDTKFCSKECEVQYKEVKD